MSFADIREFIAALADNGEVVYVSEEVDFDLELRAIACRSRGTGGANPVIGAGGGFQGRDGAGGPAPRAGSHWSCLPRSLLDSHPGRA